MASQPHSFHILEIHINGRKAFNDIRGDTSGSFSAPNTWFTIPLEANILIRIPDSTTHEIKCGKVNTVWKNFFTLGCRISFRAIAISIGMGKWNNNFPKLKISVFLKALQNSASLNMV